jgi:hypothetical protein
MLLYEARENCIMRSFIICTLHQVYLYDQAKEVRMGRARSTNGANIWILEGNSEGKRPLGGPHHMSKDNIKMDLEEIGWSDMDWIDLVQDRDQYRVLVNAGMNLQVP